jgi:hypothetical protein
VVTSRQQAPSVVQVPFGPQNVELVLTQSALVVHDFLQPVPKTQAKRPQALLVRWPQLPAPSQ